MQEIVIGFAIVPKERKINLTDKIERERKCQGIDSSYTLINVRNNPTATNNKHSESIPGCQQSTLYWF